MASQNFGSSFFQNFRRNRGTGASHGRRRGPLSLGFESLESRQMMAADMAEIIGTVRVDLQNDNNAANDVVLAGAALSLYRDGGNGVFDNGGGDDVLVGNPTSSDAQGKYRFSGLGAGKYFAKLSLPADLQAKTGGLVREVNISAAEAEGTSGIKIDGFTSTQKVEAAPPLPSSSPSTLTDSAVLGGERDMFVQLTAGTDIFSSVSLISGGGLLRLASDTTVTGNAKIIWDGVDGSATSVNPTGLGGLDFTQFNGNTMNGIRLAVGADHANSVVKLKVYTDANHWTEFLTTVPETAGGAATKQVTFNFDATPLNSAGGGADFSDIGAVELTFEGVSAVDGQVSVVDVVGFTTKNADFTAYNRMSLGDRVWNDANNNAKLDGAEAGVGGVTLNLYSDVDGNNQYSPGIDTLAGTTTTDGTGHYLFTNLFAGKYVVQVDASNFNSGKPLSGLKSSTGSTVDPDNDVDNDDNGTPLDGEGVFSQAIVLVGLGEPTNDGDDANSNRTVDFGFFGFDLVLDKETDKEAVSPNETITYTVTVTNDGPSAASGVQFLDNLPTGVTFKSLSVSKGGVSLNHSNGVITGSLGTMNNGDVVVVTILATVKATASGVLVNEAEVSAPNEENILNNYDEVENEVTPKIDLSIDKSDSADPVKPGQTFSYLLRIKNNGPSNATGVQIVDDLPAEVTFVSASRTNVSSIPGQLVFDIGNLASGATVDVTINVKVNAGVTGTFINHSEVSGNEIETTYVNNQDDEPTTVNVDPASITGFVYVDKNNNGVKEASERPIGNVTVTLTGTESTGGSVTRTTVTDANGRYAFTNLKPGQYQVLETHPTVYKDGKDTVGENGDGLQSLDDGLLALDQNDQDDFDADAFGGIVLDGGFAAKDYNFGELAVTVSKRDFLGRARYRS